MSATKFTVGQLARITDTKLKARMLFCLGDVFDQLNLPDWGIKSYRAGLAFNPGFARGHLRLGIDLEGYGKDKQGALREYETAAAVCGGLTNAEAAARLGISVNAVKLYLRTIYEKLGVHSRAELKPYIYGEP